MFNSKKIIVVGGGFAGIRAALDLSKLLADASITLINNSSFHQFHADLYEIATARLKGERKIDFNGLSGTVNIPLEQIFSKHNVNLEVGNVEKIDLKKREIYTEKKSFNYDYLILALGSDTNYFAIKGAKQFSHPFKNTADALNVRNDLEELLRARGEKITVVTVGGGFTGVELVAEMRIFLPPATKLFLLEGSGELISGMPKWSRKMTLKRLTKLGIQVKLNFLVNQVDPDKIISKEGNVIYYDYLIWVAGVKGENISKNIIGAQFNNCGQVPVSQKLNLEKFPEVFVIGDLAEFVNESEKLPQTAWAAINMAKTAAKNIKLSLIHQNLLEFIPPNSAYVVPLGKKFAISNAFGLQITGIIGWCLKRFVALRYFLSILNPFEAVKIWWKGVEIFIKND